jgi:hypothetical protein
MFTAKDIEIKVIDSTSSRRIVERHHYSGKCTQNSQIHFGVFLNGKLEGALQFGPSIDKRRMAQNLGIGFNESLELNRMALSDNCPKNSESRALGICLRILKKKYPHLKIIISFADACQCGDGTIYRASGFKLHSYKVNSSLFYIPESVVPFIKKYLPGYNGGVLANKALNNVVDENGRYLTTKVKQMGARALDGFQMKYLYFFDKELEKKFKFIDFDKIPDQVRMYKGSKRSEHENNASNFQLEESGAIPTTTLQSNGSYE